MNDLARAASVIGRPAPDEAARAVAASRRLFQRVLSAWVCDLLALRRAGMERPDWRPESAREPWSEAA